MLEQLDNKGGELRLRGDQVHGGELAGGVAGGGPRASNAEYGGA